MHCSPATSSAHTHTHTFLFHSVFHQGCVGSPPTLAELGPRQSLLQAVQRPPQQAQVADVQVHSSVELRVGEAGLLVGFHVLLQVPADLGQRLGLCCWVDLQLARCRPTQLQEGSFSSLVFFQHVPDLLQRGLHIGEDARESCGSTVRGTRSAQTLRAAAERPAEATHPAWTG